MPSTNFQRHNIAFMGSVFDEIMDRYENYAGEYTGNPPSSEEEYAAWLAKFPDVFDGASPAWAEVETKMAEEVVCKNRAAAYPDWTLQLEKIYDDGIDAWKTDMINPVKEAFPK